MYKKISPVEAKKIMDTQNDIVILDVREKEELEEGYIDGCILIPEGEILDIAPKKITDKHKTILVYCRSGKRSLKACKDLVKLGYDKVYDFGGIIDWPFEIVM